MVIKKELEGKLQSYCEEFYDNDNLSLREKGILVTLIGMPEGSDFNVPTLASYLPDGMTAVYAYLHKLESLGYIERRAERNSHRKILSNDVELFFPK